ncbi:MAG TPA: hypothetical protein VM487_07240, partial [Phycisphaerae bacterium]|nr:hypothetical protein [Phycisphaerae bacterium]
RLALEGLADEGLIVRGRRRQAAEPPPAELPGPVLLQQRGPLPDGLGPNAREHRYEQARINAAWRELWRLKASNQFAGVPFGRVRVNITARFCRKTAAVGRMPGYRPTDTDNLTGSMKPAIDGIVDAGIIPDDRAEYIERPEPWIVEVGTSAEECILVQIVPLAFL